MRAAPSEGDLRLADVLASLSLVADLGFGLPAEQAVRTCVAGGALARRLGLDDTGVADVLYTGLLAHLGCVGFAHEAAVVFGDELAMGRAAEQTNQADPHEVARSFVSSACPPAFSAASTRSWNGGTAGGLPRPRRRGHSSRRAGDPGGASGGALRPRRRARHSSASGACQGRRSLGPAGVAGGVLAVAGIAVLSLPSLGGGDLPLLSLLAAVGAAVAAAESAVMVKGFPRVHPVSTNTVGMAAGALLLWIASALTSEPWGLPELARTWTALAWLVIAGSVGLFYLFVFVIGRWTASAAASAVTLMPIVAVSLGALLAGEQITMPVVIGATLVVLAVYIGALRRR